MNAERRETSEGIAVAEGITLGWLLWKKWTKFGDELYFEDMVNLCSNALNVNCER